MNKLAVLAIVAVVVFAAGTAALILRGFSTSRTVANVVIANYEFGPSTATVRAGTTVRWTNMDHVAHSVMMGAHDDSAGGMDSGLLGHMATFAYTFQEPGTYEYHCDPHPYMTGIVIVTP